MIPLLLQLCCCHGVALAHPDSVTRIPGQPHVEFHQFSGYVPVDHKNQRALFFYFAEAQKDAASKPLVLWLNGGPPYFFSPVFLFLSHTHILSHPPQTITDIEQ